MKRIGEDRIEINDYEAQLISIIILSGLYRAWDNHSDSVPLEDGMKSMDPEAYEIANTLATI